MITYRRLLWIVSIAIVAFLILPILIILIYAFDVSNVQIWPIPGFSLRWFADTINDSEVRDAFLLSAEIAALATLIATIIGTLAALATNRLRPIGREAMTLMLTLPIALPGILTGMALNAYFVYFGQPLSWISIVIGHTTFCSVIVYNNVMARLRRLPPSLLEASADLGASPFGGFRRITLPLIASAIRAGALLSFALSFDEVIVTTFTAGTETTLPLWIFGAIRLGQKLPEVNVVVFGVIALTVVPVLLAQNLAGDEGRRPAG